MNDQHADLSGKRRGEPQPGGHPKWLRDPYEGWIAADPFRGGVRLLITGAHGFHSEVAFAMDEEPAVITQLVRATLDE